MTSASSYNKSRFQNINKSLIASLILPNKRTTKPEKTYVIFHPNRPPSWSWRVKKQRETSATEKQQWPLLCIIMKNVAGRDATQFPCSLPKLHISNVDDCSLPAFKCQPNVMNFDTKLVLTFAKCHQLYGLHSWPLPRGSLDPTEGRPSDFCYRLALPRSPWR
jgi:hypothetical protein